MDPSTINWKGYTFLIAEDYEASYLFLKDSLRPTGVKILKATTGLEAIEQVKNKSVDLILMDLKMPELYGLEAIKEIKKIDGVIPVIAQTAYALEEDEEMCLKEGFDAYLSKPIDYNKLLNTILKFIPNNYNNK